MKKNLTLATILVAAVAMLASCGGGDKFKTTDGGLHYKFEKQDKNAQQVQDGDVLIGEMTMLFEADTVFSNVGHADRILQATPTFDGDLYEGLLMMHIGDVATFAIEADSLAKFLQSNQMHKDYKPGTGQKIYYHVNLQDIVTKEELMQEQSNFMQEMQERKQAEPEMIAKYIADNNIKVKPTADGLYIIVKKKGTGAKVATGKEVAINYTGRLLDGTMFDSSVEGDARQGGIYNPQREPYEPLKYIVGQMGLIRGWEEGIMGQPAGTILQLVIPSEMAYGSQGAGNRIQPFSPLVFDLEIVSVK